MAEVNTKMMYDEEEDILSLSRGREIKASVDIGDFIIDIDHQGFVTGLEVLNASSNLNVNLKNLKKVLMNITYKPNYVYIFLTMNFENKEKEISIPLTINLGHGEITSESAQFAIA
tara:strand:+ start:1310 stop:1657 length:348 start_codon:yes stop_codon:yes gene_type:complete